MRNLKGIIALVALCALAAANDALAVIYQMPLPRDAPTSVQVATSFDNSSHLYTYSYTLQNPASNAKGLGLLMLQLQSGVDVVTDIQAPDGWSGSYLDSKHKVTWAATKVTVPAGFIDNGNMLPGDADVPSGGSLAGFSFKSFSAPGTGLAITQIDVPLPSADGDDELAGLPYESTVPENNGYRLQLAMPVPDADWSGNRRPAVDNFLVFANTRNKDSFSGSALIVIRLASGGETVYPATLQVTLNGQNVTAMFQQSSAYNGLAASLTTVNSALKVGTNTLLTGIDGIVPGTTDHVATDHDKISFDFSL